MTVGVVVERRKAKSAWIDFIWKPVGVLVGIPAALPWSMLSEDNESASFYAGIGEIKLYRTETGNYRDNLASGNPSLWVALRPTGLMPPYELFGITADPAEGEAWTETGTDLVEAVPMPPLISEWVASFIAEHHVERKFEKRERSRADPQALARRPAIKREQQ
jgi:hypothetical protein